MTRIGVGEEGWEKRVNERVSESEGDDENWFWLIYFLFFERFYDAYGAFWRDRCIQLDLGALVLLCTAVDFRFFDLFFIYQLNFYKFLASVCTHFLIW